MFLTTHITISINTIVTDLIIQASPDINDFNSAECPRTSALA